MTQGTDEPTRDDGTKDPFRSPPAYVPIETASDAGPRPEGGLLDGPGLDGPIVPGQVLFGRFKVLRKIADGGMGQVWLVRHRELDSERALKLIPPLCAIDESARMRFGREARTLARLAHPNIVVVHDAQLSGHTVFIEMEFVRGQGLDTRMGRGVPMPLDGIGRILMQLCAALQAAHDQHIVHRDLKPSNLMLVDGRPPGEELLKVLDFGIAKILSAETQGPDGRPLTEGFIGTVPYASPEQVLDRPVDGRGDIYSTGVILYEMLTGSRPFAGTLLEQMHAHAYQPPPPMGLKNPRTHVPLEVEKVVMRCLAKDPAGRPQSPRELAEEFRRAVDLDPSPPRRRWPAFMAMAGVLALLVGLVVASRPRPPRLTAGPSASPPASFPPADVTNEDRRSREGIGAEYVLGAILRDVRTLAPADRPFARYFSLNHLRAGGTEDKLDRHRAALAEVINHRSRQKERVRPQSIDPTSTVYRVDLRALGWDERPFERIVAGTPAGSSPVNLFDLALLEYPYGVIPEASATFDRLAAEFLAPADQVRPIAYVRADWFVGVATRPPLDAVFLLRTDAPEDSEARLGGEARAGRDASRASALDGLGTPILPLDGLTRPDFAPDQLEGIVELKTNQANHIFSPGDELVVTVVNHSGRDLFLELIGTSARGKMVILAASTTVVPAGQSFRYPPEGALRIQPDPGRERITAFVGASAFPPGELLRGRDVADRVVHRFDGLQRVGEHSASPFDPAGIVKRTIVIETR